MPKVYDIIAQRGVERAREGIFMEGRSEGMREGRLQERRQMIAAMLEDGIPLDRVCRISGLSVAEIGNLLRTDAQN